MYFLSVLIATANVVNPIADEGFVKELELDEEEAVVLTEESEELKQQEIAFEDLEEFYLDMEDEE
jgi:hypothetical protein